MPTVAGHNVATASIQRAKECLARQSDATLALWRTKLQEQQAEAIDRNNRHGWAGGTTTYLQTIGQLWHKRALLDSEIAQRAKKREQAQSKAIAS